MIGETISGYKILDKLGRRRPAVVLGRKKPKGMAAVDPIITRRDAILLFGLVGLATPSGCKRSERKRIGVVPKATGLVFWQSVHAGAVAGGREAGVEVLWQGPATETEFTRQITIVESMINSRVDGIVVAPTDATALISVVDRAQASGIPVVVFDSGINSDNYISFVATDNYQGGVLGARRMGELLNGSGQVAMMRMVPGSHSTNLREEGFKDTLAKEFEQIEIVAEDYCMADHAKSLEIAENFLTAHPDLDGIFGSTEPATVGPARAIRGRGLSGKVRLVGFDYGDTIEQDLKDGVIDAVVVQDPFRIGFLAVQTMVSHLNGETSPKRIDTPVRVVGAADLSDPEILGFLHPDLERYLE